MTKDETLDILYELKSTFALVASYKEKMEENDLSIANYKEFQPIIIENEEEYINVDNKINESNNKILEIDNEIKNEEDKLEKLETERNNLSNVQQKDVYIKTYFDCLKNKLDFINKKFYDFFSWLKDEYTGFFYTCIGLLVLNIPLSSYLWYCIITKVKEAELIDFYVAIISTVIVSILLLPFIIYVFAFFIICIISLIQWIVGYKKCKKEIKTNYDKYLRIKEENKKKIVEIDKEKIKINEKKNEVCKAKIIENNNFTELQHCKENVIISLKEKEKNDFEIYKKEKEENIINMSKEKNDIGIIATNIYETITNKYKNVIAQSDYKNIDYLIYYLTTGRADTLKEALLLLDNKLQNDRIVYSIASLQKTIVVNYKNITNSIDAISKIVVNLSNSISLMSNSLDSISNSINSFNESTNASLKKLSDKADLHLSKMMDHNQITEMVLKKISNSCEDLVDSTQALASEMSNVNNELIYLNTHNN